MMHVIINTLGNAEIKYYLLKDFYSIICFYLKCMYNFTKIFNYDIKY